ncbi:hypothetical protein [Kurthia sibirica]|uniref:Uncharacterized protein n=1 Tax=Kurthia sibirica TaxID=202750 RepID=A0A2U3AKC5_9BACL|nr:hypothetical protein [Kurthia sibirica]PWI24982.1 hypothetical protein DEX24_10430 [Kurthia sibirica]GEK33112.1 hypothetical protein KSI01_06450 [Kurthia sibirica]
MANICTNYLTVYAENDNESLKKFHHTLKTEHASRFNFDDSITYDSSRLIGMNQMSYVFYTKREPAIEWFTDLVKDFSHLTFEYEYEEPGLRLAGCLEGIGGDITDETTYEGNTTLGYIEFLADNLKYEICELEREYSSDLASEFEADNRITFTPCRTDELGNVPVTLRSTISELEKTILLEPVDARYMDFEEDPYSFYYYLKEEKQDVLAEFQQYLTA